MSVCTPAAERSPSTRSEIVASTSPPLRRARRTAIAFDAATLVFTPAAHGSGYSARIYLGRDAKILGLIFNPR